MKYYAGDVVVGHPSFDSKAATSQSNAPAALAASNIVYSKEDDDAIDEYHRRTGLSSSLVYVHPRSGTDLVVL